MKKFQAEVLLSDEQIAGLFAMFVDTGLCQSTNDPVEVLVAFINRETDIIARTLSEKMAAYRISKMVIASPIITTTVKVV